MQYEEKKKHNQNSWLFFALQNKYTAECRNTIAAKLSEIKCESISWWYQTVNSFLQKERSTICENWHLSLCDKKNDSLHEYKTHDGI